MKKISFITPSRNGLKYLKWSYNSLRKNCNPQHEICMYDDFSNDGTWEWMNEIKKKDSNIQIFRNDGPDRLGHTILYDRLVESATNEIVMIWHNDMYASPEMDKELLRLLKPKTIVSATRIEPPLHPEEPNTKIIKDFGIEPEEFKEEEFLKFVDDKSVYNMGKSTNGVFAPWLCYKSDFQEINGHDPLFAPQSKEDDDFWIRFMINGGKFIQSWEALIYHLTCRGSRMANGASRNFTGQAFIKGRETSEWLIQNRKSERNFVRKWGFTPHHTTEHKPIVPHKYDVSFVVENCNPDILDALEPWCSRIYCDINKSSIEYIKNEQLNTMYNLSKRVLSIKNIFVGDIIVKFDAKLLTQQKFQEFITQLSFILDQIKDIGEYEFDIFNVRVNRIEYYENELIVCDKTKVVR